MHSGWIPIPALQSAHHVWSTFAKGSSRNLTLIVLAVCALEKTINGDNEHRTAAQIKLSQMPPGTCLWFRLEIGHSKEGAFYN